jgi:hypothetical protein
MIVYGDRAWQVDARTALHALRARTGDDLIVDVGMFTQALLDREAKDELTPLAEACSKANDAAARGQLELRALEPFATGALTLRHPEGYAFYALYPELYASAARQLRGQDVQVIGIRSIGSSLASVVAAALDSRHPTRTVRPRGHPFSRTLELGPALERDLLSGQTRYAIVDEGPGLSGSSFDAVARWLIERGVAPERIVIFPSHAGEPGAHASPGARARYRAIERVHVAFDALFDPARLARWFEDITGPAQLEDLSAGRWRRLFYAPSQYPASHLRNERRKYLLRSARGSYLMKFTGLGGLAPALAARAQRLSDAGFTPRLLSVRDGFSLSEFQLDATPAARAPRASWAPQVARYLAFLREQCPAPRQGASLEQLSEMCKYNASQLGIELECAPPSHAQPIEVDNKLELCEWLVTRDGRVLKCDAEDHHAGHDLIGCQDPAWDVAGAMVELGLSARELDYPSDTLAFYTRAYAAFRAGKCKLAVDELSGWADDDAARMRVELERYCQLLRR